MTMDAGELRDALEFAVSISKEAGEITLNLFRQPFAIETKRDGSFVTAVDRAAEAHLRRRIAETFPDDGTLGEEEWERAGASVRRWIIDRSAGLASDIHRA